MRLKRDTESGRLVAAAPVEEVEPISTGPLDDAQGRLPKTAVPRQSARSSGVRVSEPVQAVAKRPSRTKFYIAGAVLCLILLALGAFYYRAHRQNKVLGEKDTLVLADFDNSTGDPLFDDTLKTALSVSLRQSPFLNVLSDSQVGKTLKLMTLPRDTKLTSDVARDLCQRSGSKAFVTGTISSLGSEYVVGLKAVNCQSGEVLAQEQVTAESKEKVLNALGDATTKLRSELGESLATVRKFDVPLVEATTSSLEALKAYSVARNVSFEKGLPAALPDLQRAIELDPNFASAYSSIGNAYSSLGEAGRSGEYLTKAFALRDHASEREKLGIAANYYHNAAGDLNRAASAYQEEIENYPQETGSYGNLGIVYGELGEYDKAIEITRRGIQLQPDRPSFYDDLANFSLALQHCDEAGQILAKGYNRPPDDAIAHNALYGLAFIAGDSAAMEKQEEWYANNPQSQNWGLALASDSEAYSGHLNKAREFTRRAVDSAIQTDSKEGGGVWLALSAQRESVYGNPKEGLDAAAAALKLAPESVGVEAENALAFAMAGDTAEAESLLQDLGRRFPQNTQVQSQWLPAIQAQLALKQKNPSLALNDLQAASSGELGIVPFEINLSCLYPVYIRGEAYLDAGQGPAAAAEFQKIIDHSGIVWNCWTGAVAHLGLARANALESRTSQGADADAARVRALAAYKDFLTLWKDADPDIPLLREAKAEYAKLQ